MAPASGLPSARYAAGVSAARWQDDPAQRHVLQAFDRLASELSPPLDDSLWQRVRRRFRDEPVRGIYLWGRVGRGKTFLTDLFYASVEGVPKRRVHFHAFMRGVQAELKTLEGQSDPLVQVAARIAAETRLLCLDEFFVSDIGDAMILANLFRGLFERGVVLVTTSNVAPPDLYRDGLQRAGFLPTIALLQQHCEIVEMVSPQDWRLRNLRQAAVYHTPLGADTLRAMRASFQRLAGEQRREDVSLQVNDRALRARGEGHGVIWFDFAELCEGPRAVADYIELARSFHTLMISDVPQFTPQTEDAARRFVELVDEMYDRGVNLVLSAATPVIDLYDGERLRMEFARTESRLIEMQSEDYLAREHRA